MPRSEKSPWFTIDERLNNKLNNLSKEAAKVLGTNLKSKRCQQLVKNLDPSLQNSTQFFKEEVIDLTESTTPNGPSTVNESLMNFSDNELVRFSNDLKKFRFS